MNIRRRVQIIAKHCVCKGRYGEPFKYTHDKVFFFLGHIFACPLKQNFSGLNFRADFTPKTKLIIISEVSNQRYFLQSDLCIFYCLLAKIGTFFGIHPIVHSKHSESIINYSQEEWWKFSSLLGWYDRTMKNRTLGAW